MPAYPDVPSATIVASETVNPMPAYQAVEIPDVPAYLTIDLVIIVLVVVTIIIGLCSIINKQE